ncbi:hypothetical protein DFJ63DRAFT_290539 [Scheffersomyces coipomensis]|uniref:uncharacterized protein n=1 Tax=Scheffersomyces coipomensis TaxID=1788519 RepID=UPI00315D3E87
MATLIPASSACYTLSLPPTEKDERLNLNVRTGSSSTLYNSLVLTFGGLTIGIELYELTIDEIHHTFYDKISTSNSKYKTLEKYLSGELFYLSLIERSWTRVEFDKDVIRPRPRLLHQICAINNCLYLFGGLILSGNDLSESLIPCNDLWEFDLETKKWTLLHDGNGYENDSTIPIPRFNHKMTSIGSLTFVNRKDHFGIFIAGGKDKNSNPIYNNVMFDLVEKKYVGTEPIILKTSSGNSQKDSHLGLDNVVANDDHELSVDYLNSMILNYTEELESSTPTTSISTPNQPNNNSQSQIRKDSKQPSGKVVTNKNEVNLTTNHEESIIVYAPTTNKNPDALLNPLLSFKISKHIKSARPLPVHKKKILKHTKATTTTTTTPPVNVKNTLNQTVPFNLRYPTGGLFGQNIVITGFLPNDFDISIFIYNKPTGKWSRLNVFCNHDYGSHRFWGGFAWQSHHKVVLIGNYLTSRTTSSIRFFTVMITVSLPVTNILASSEMAGVHHHHHHGKRIAHRQVSRNSFSSGARTGDELTDETCSSVSVDDLTDDEDDIGSNSKTRRSSNLSQTSSATSPTTISFSEYVHYAAPKTNFTNIRSVFPPAAITLGRNAFDRYGDLISDFELVSCTGDRIPVALIVLMERWGSYFIKLLARGYIQAVDKFESDQALGVFHNDDKGRLRTSKSTGGGSTSSSNASNLQSHQSKLKTIEPANSIIISSFSSSNSLLASQLQDIPPQLPLPVDQIPAVPTNTSFRASSRKNSQDFNSPRASLIHTLTALRNIPLSRSPKDSPYASPRASLSAQGGTTTIIGSGDLYANTIPSLRPNKSKFNESYNDLGTDPTDTSTTRRESNLSSVDLKEGVQKNSSVSTVLSEPFSVSSEKDSHDDGGEDDEDYSEHNDTSEHLFSEKEDRPKSGLFDNVLLNFDNLENDKFQMEPSLIPRKLYVPFSTVTLKAFCEYLYTGQVGNKWLLTPTALDNLAIAKFFKVPLLYDLISEVLFGIIGRKEVYVVREGNKLKRRYFQLLDATNTPLDPKFRFPLDEYEGFMDTVDDGYLDIALLKKTSNINKLSVVSFQSSRKKKSIASSLHRPSESGITENDEEDDDEEENVKVPVNEKDDEVKDNSTDESSDKKLTSTSEEDNENDIELGFLNSHEVPTTGVGPRSKSVFDRSNTVYNEFANVTAAADEDGHNEKDKAARLTLEQLVSPNSEVPSDYIIDLIYESAAIVTDLKIMLRAANARLMSKTLQESKIEIGAKIQELKQKYEAQKNAENLAKEVADTTGFIPVSGVTTVSSVRSRSKTPGPEFEPFNQSSTDLKPSISQASLTTVGSVKYNASLEKVKSNTSFRNIGGFTPFKTSKPEKEIDKRLNKIMKKEDKLKSKTDIYPSQDKDSKKKNKFFSSSSTRVNEINNNTQPSGTSPTPSITSTTTNSGLSKKHHGLFHLTKKRETNDDSSVESGPKLIRTQSSTGSINSSTSKSDASSNGKKKHGLFSFKKHT